MELQPESFALAPLILALLRSRPTGELEIAGSLRLRPATPGQGFLLGYLCGILWYAGTCYWIYDTMRQYGGLNAPEALLALFLFCCYLGLYHGLFGMLVSLLAGSGRDFRRRLSDRSPRIVAAPVAGSLSKKNMFASSTATPEGFCRPENTPNGLWLTGATAQPELA